LWKMSRPQIRTSRQRLTTSCFQLVFLLFSFLYINMMEQFRKPQMNTRRRMSSNNKNRNRKNRCQLLFW
jgi:hypothetical protein